MAMLNNEQNFKRKRIDGYDVVGGGLNMNGDGNSYLDAGEYLGIGTTAPAYPLHIIGQNNEGIYFDSDGGEVTRLYNDGSHNRFRTEGGTFYIDCTTGKVSINTGGQTTGNVDLGTPGNEVRARASIQVDEDLNVTGDTTLDHLALDGESVNATYAITAAANIEQANSSTGGYSRRYNTANTHFMDYRADTTNAVTVRNLLWNVNETSKEYKYLIAMGDDGADGYLHLSRNGLLFTPRDNDSLSNQAEHPLDIRPDTSDTFQIHRFGYKYEIHKTGVLTAKTTPLGINFTLDYTDVGSGKVGWCYIIADVCIIENDDTSSNYLSIQAKFKSNVLDSTGTSVEPEERYAQSKDSNDGSGHALDLTYNGSGNFDLQLETSTGWFNVGGGDTHDISYVMSFTIIPSSSTDLTGTPTLITS